MSSIIQEYGSKYVYLHSGGQWFVFDRTSSPLGMGAVGIVYLGYNYTTKVPVAIKMIRPEYSGNPEVRTRARGEALLTFLHPNIVRMIGICESEYESGPIFLLSEYVDGMDWNSYSRALLPWTEHSRHTAICIDHAISILDALHYIHSAGLIHRDVKPSNIMITRNGIPKLMDLGIAGFSNSESLDTRSFTGTALYAAPELITGKPIDRRIDIYAAGVSLFEILCGYNPFSRNTQDEILEAHLHEGLPEDERIPEGLLSILLKATAINKNNRYGDAKAFADDLKAYQG